MLVTYNLQLDGFALKLNCADFEIHPDSRYVTFGVRVILSKRSRSSFT